jgi:hypothetical protein
MSAKSERSPQSIAHPLAEGFSFSQSSLQAYEDCPRRFWLAYVQQLPWPAVEASPVQEHEELMRLGEAFHRLVERAEIGLDADLLSIGLPSPLSTWLDAYQRHRPVDLPTEFVEVEKALRIRLDDLWGDGSGVVQPSSYSLAAKYDLIAAETGGRVVIMDWKTTRRRTEPTTLRLRLQTLIYPFLLVEASQGLPFGPLRPEQVEMRYWFTAAPEQPVIFRYDAAQHEANRQRIAGFIAAILSGRRESDFPKVPDSEINRKRFCGYCVYRSRCGRGQAAADLASLEEDEDFFVIDPAALEFTLEDVPELAF